MIGKYKLYYRVFIAVFWIAMTFGFVADELLPFLEPLRPAVFLLLDGLVVLLGLATLRQRGDIIVALSYMAIAVVSSLIVNHCSVATFVNGSRDFVGLVLMVPVLRYFLTCRYADDFRKSFNRQLRIWLWLQAFCITWQFALYGANDHGGGSMGFGASGITSMLIYLVSFYLITRNWDSSRYWDSLKRNKEYIFLLYPTLLNETKASFIMLVIYFLLLVKYDRLAVMRLLLAFPISVCAFVVLAVAYFDITDQDPEKVLSKEFFQNYFYGEDLDFLVEVGWMLQDGEMEIDPSNWWTLDIPRFAKPVLVTPMLRSETNGGVWLGAGVGQFKGGQVMSSTRFAQNNQWLLQGSKILLFFVYVQLGIIGLIWIIAVLARDLWPRVNRQIPFSMQVQLFVLADMLLIFIYNDSIRVLSFCLVFFYVALSMQPLKQASAKAVSADVCRDGTA